MEDPADITGIEMEMREQKLGRVQVTQFDAGEVVPVDICFESTGMTCLCHRHRKPEPPPDMSGFKMTTIRDPGSAGAMVAFAVLVVVVLILVLVMS